MRKGASLFIAHAGGLNQEPFPGTVDCALRRLPVRVKMKLAVVHRQQMMECFLAQERPGDGMNNHSRIDVDFALLLGSVDLKYARTAAEAFDLDDVAQAYLAESPGKAFPLLP